MSKTLPEDLGFSEAVVSYHDRMEGQWAPHRPARPDKLEGGKRLEVVSDYEPAGDQPAAIAELVEGIKEQEHDQVLLGVTGSGKTEVYLEAIAETLRLRPTTQICILLPEIALTLPFLKRIEERFGAAAAHWHSDVSSAERRRVWRRVAEGQARLVVGARSALFLPYTDLALIVVDEEHEAAYKQHDGVLYQGRDMAVARGALGNFPVLLVSATPSLETLANADAHECLRNGVPHAD